MGVMSRSKDMAAYCGRGGICFLTTHPVRANWNLSGIFKLLKFSVFPASLIFVCYVQFTGKKITNEVGLTIQFTFSYHLISKKYYFLVYI